jgi:hypothetical protein
MVSRGLAKGSQGPAMPTTARLPLRANTSSKYTMAWAGLSTALVTPGRVSLTQSNFRLQKLH